MWSNKMLIFVLFLNFYSVSAVFAPADRTALRAAVQSCLSETTVETGDGSCPTFAASNDATGNPYGVMGDWDVSKVTNMYATFYDVSAFNADISNWNTVAVTNMESMFQSAPAFNADISKWDTAAVTTMRATFSYASTFNSDISKWNTAAVTDMKYTFNRASAFNSDISKWNTAAVTIMRNSTSTPLVSVVLSLEIHSLFPFHFFQFFPTVASNEHCAAVPGCL